MRGTRTTRRTSTIVAVSTIETKRKRNNIALVLAHVHPQEDLENPRDDRGRRVASVVVADLVRAPQPIVVGVKLCYDGTRNLAVAPGPPEVGTIAVGPLRCPLLGDDRALVRARAVATKAAAQRFILMHANCFPDLLAWVIQESGPHSSAHSSSTPTLTTCAPSSVDRSARSSHP